MQPCSRSWPKLADGIRLMATTLPRSGIHCAHHAWHTVQGSLRGGLDAIGAGSGSMKCIGAGSWRRSTFSASHWRQEFLFHARAVSSWLTSLQLGIRGIVLLTLTQDGPVLFTRAARAVEDVDEEHSSSLPGVVMLSLLIQVISLDHY